MQRPRNGHGRASEEAQKVVEHRKESRDCGVEGGDGPDHGAAVSGSGTAAQRTEEGKAVADAATADQTMAGDGGAGAGSVLRSEAHAGTAVRVRLHAHDRTGNHARGPDVRAPGVPLRADVLE